ncbi:hypothetical protein R50072_28760 [Simiduia litorea]|uniref:substrate-binding periplasmic protein n=1 Tax=Simiduia litorea TaxID=1435348 RepID=UPI0036F3AC8C
MLIFLVVVAFATKAQELRVCGEDADYSPYINDQGQGILKDLVELAAVQSGLTVHYAHRPLKRCQLMVHQGELDAMMAIGWTEERGKSLIYPMDDQRQLRESQRIWLSEFVLFTHKDSVIEWDGEAFKGLTFGVGTPLGYVSEQRLKQLKALSPNSVTLEQGLTLVSLERLDGYVTERQIGWQAAKKLGLEAKLKILPTPLLELPWFVAFSPRYFQENPAQVIRFWRALAAERERNVELLKRRYDLTTKP